MDAATKISVDRMERAGYLPALRTIAKSACVPFWWHGVADDGRYRIHRNGTVSFLNTGKRLIGVTAHHVFDAYRTARQAQPDLRCQFGSTTVEPERRLIAESKYLDLATFDISPIVITSAGAAPHTPTAWPTPRAHVKEIMLYGGFPGSLREEHEYTADLPFQWFAGAPISVTPENVKLHIDLANFHRPLVGSTPGNIELGGMSGGPVFRLITTPIERLELVAFIYEHSLLLSLVYARPSGYIAEDGGINEDPAV